MRELIVGSLCLLFSGCVSVTTGLQLAEFGVKVGFDIHNYVEAKKEEAKEIASEVQHDQSSGYRFNHAMYDSH